MQLADADAYKKQNDVLVLRISALQQELATSREVMTDMEKLVRDHICLCVCVCVFVYYMYTCIFMYVLHLNKRVATGACNKS